ncbi:MAG TPA: sugar ABC transporter ATP-binding protein [Blastocatellia bacterium]|nr:sugar ABC transporter ATP-binding protein [Blastocatellia bacterium]
MVTPLLDCSQIEKRFFGVPVLHGVNLTLAPGRVLGLVGENGAGKSTLMNILGGVVQADGGTMTLAGEAYAPLTPADATRRGVAFVHQELNLFTNLSIAENLFLPHLPRRKTMRTKAAELLAAVNLDIAPDTLVESLSPGERQLVEIAKALGQEARLMIFDEPTTSLTSRETERLFALIERLRAQGIAVIYISHVLADVFRLCDELLVLRDGEVVAAGSKDEFTPESLITLMVGRSLSQLYPPRHTQPTSETVLAVKAVSQPGVLENVSFKLQRGEVLGVAGLMGAGRTELARILFGLDPCARGSVHLNGAELRHRSTRERIQLGMALLTENRREEGLLMEAGLADNIALAALAGFTTRGLIASARLNEAVNEAVAAVQIKGASRADQAVRTLSGGNQQKVVLAKWLLQKPSVFILDEPTRGVDVGARAEIYRLINQLTEQGSGVLFISSEIEELIGMCDRLFVMRQGTITANFVRAEFDRERILNAALNGGVTA